MQDYIEVTQQIPLKRVYNLLVNAIEGGSNYWYRIEKVKRPVRPYTFTDSIWALDRAKFPDYINQCEVPFNKGGALMISDFFADEPMLKKPVALDLKAITLGLKAWQEDSQMEDGYSAHPSHWANFISGNDDAETADVFLQYCIFGKVIYG